MTKYSEEELIEELQRVSEEYCDGKTPTFNFFRGKTGISQTTIEKMFGSWNGLIFSVGMEPNQYIGKNVSEDELLKEVNEIANKINDTPRQRDITEKSKYSVELFRNKFGSWNEVIEKCGFQPNMVEEYSIKELSKEIHRVSEELSKEKGPTLEEFRKKGNISQAPYIQRFGSWNKTLEFLASN